MNIFVGKFQFGGNMKKILFASTLVLLASCGGSTPSKSLPLAKTGLSFLRSKGSLPYGVNG